MRKTFYCKFKHDMLSEGKITGPITELIVHTHHARELRSIHRQIIIIFHKIPPHLIHGNWEIQLNHDRATKAREI